MKDAMNAKYYLNLAQVYLLQNRADNTAIRVYQFVLQQYENPPLKEMMEQIISQKHVKKNKRSIRNFLGENLMEELYRMGTT